MSLIKCATTFKCEWSSGRKAKLTLECHAGHDLSLLELSLGRAPGHSEAGAKSRTRPPSYARRQERKKATKAAATVTASGVNPVEIAVVKSVRGVANNADNAEEEVVKAGAAVQAVQNATEEASTKDAEVDTIAAKATVSGGVKRVAVEDDTEKAVADVQAAIELDGNEVPRRVEEKIDSLYKSRNI